MKPERPFNFGCASGLSCPLDVAIHESSVSILLEGVNYHYLPYGNTVILYKNMGKMLIAFLLVGSVIFATKTDNHQTTATKQLPIETLATNKTVATKSNDGIPSPFYPPVCGPPTDQPCETPPPAPAPAPEVPDCALVPPFCQ